MGLNGEVLSGGTGERFGLNGILPPEKLLLLLSRSTLLSRKSGGILDRAANEFSNWG